jgi:hypothetical protein
LGTAKGKIIGKIKSNQSTLTNINKNEKEKILKREYLNNPGKEKMLCPVILFN